MDVGKTLAALAREAFMMADETRVRGEQPNPRMIALAVLDRHPEVDRQFFSVLVRLVREHLDEVETPVG